MVFSKGRLEQSPFFIVNSIRNCLKQRGPGQGPDLILMEWNGMEHFHKLEEMFLQFTAKTAIHIKKVVYVTQESGLTTGIPNAGAAAFSQIGASDCAFISRRGRRHMGRMTGILSGCNPGIKVFHQRKWDSFVSEMFRSPIPPCFWFLTAAAAAGIYGGICSGLNGLDFPAGRFVSTFLGVFLQAAPFLALGALLSSLIQVYVQPSWIRRTFPKTVLAGQLFAVAAGFCLPVCDCASIPVFKGLVKKGVPLPAAVTFMLVSPVINPVVILSTWYAFNGNYRIVAARCVLGIVCAVLCGLTFLIRTPGDCLCEDPVPVQAGCVDYRIPAWKGTGQSRLGLVIRHGQNEFFSVGKFLLIGIFVSSLFQKMVPGGLRAGEGTGSMDRPSFDDGNGFCTFPLFLLRCGGGREHGRKSAHGSNPWIFSIWPDDGYKKCRHAAVRLPARICGAAAFHHIPCVLSGDGPVYGVPKREECPYGFERKRA